VQLYEKREIVGVFVIEHALDTSELEPELNGGGARAKRRLSLAEVVAGDEVADSAIPRVALRASLQVQGVEQVEEASTDLKLRVLSQHRHHWQSECLG
jgi:hypothetical protein